MPDSKPCPLIWVQVNMYKILFFQSKYWFKMKDYLLNNLRIYTQRQWMKLIEGKTRKMFWKTWINFQICSVLVRSQGLQLWVVEVLDLTLVLESVADSTQGSQYLSLSPYPPPRYPSAWSILTVLTNLFHKVHLGEQ